MKIYWLFLFLSIFSLIVFIQSVYQSVRKKNSYQKTTLLFPLGIFVWGDGMIISLFWFIVSGLSFIYQNTRMFLILFFLFWLVRAFGEAIYWINQQFSSINRNPPEKLFGYFLVKNDSIWFLYQLFWQMVMIGALFGLIKIFFFQ